ncbi:hypothetical protein TNCT_315091 [Trichonephila clavata]|uniref:Uncharacterized protein n=1 Tax=Trichonephila clavata TaxID=2740835 RepID=A0A8X6G1Y5_TRICU|nr:hypothetical protein TNCT_315091 [Trichonephila clavata]
MFYQPRDDPDFKKFKACSREHFKILQKNKLVHNDDSNNSSFSSVPCTFGTDHNGYEMKQPKVYDDRSWDDYFADFKKWSEDYYISLRRKNKVPEGIAKDILINDLGGTKSFEMPLANGIVGQHEVQVKEEMFRQPLGSIPEDASMYFPNISSSSSCNRFNGFEVPQLRYYPIINPQYFNQLSPGMNYTVPQMHAPHVLELATSSSNCVFCFL